MRTCITTIGAIDGNIIAAIITTQTPMKNPSVPGSVPGPGVHAAHLVAGQSPRDRGEGDQQADEAELDQPGQRRGRRIVADSMRACDCYRF